MAIDNEKKALGIMKQTVQAVNVYMDAWNKMIDLRDVVLKSGITLADYDAVFATEPSVQHVTGSVVQGLLENMNTDKNAAISNNHWDVLQKTRSVS